MHAYILYKCIHILIPLLRRHLIRLLLKRTFQIFRSNMVVHIRTFLITLKLIVVDV